MDLDLHKLFSASLRRIRKARGMTQKALAEACGMDGSSIYYLERGVHFPSVPTLEMLCRVLEAKPYEFFMTPEELLGHNMNLLGDHIHNELVKDLEKIISKAKKKAAKK